MVDAVVDRAVHVAVVVAIVVAIDVIGFVLDKGIERAHLQDLQAVLLAVAEVSKMYRDGDM